MLILIYFDMYFDIYFIFCSPWNKKKISSFLLISRRIEINQFVKIGLTLEKKFRDDPLLNLFQVNISLMFQYLQ